MQIQKYNNLTTAESALLRCVTPSKFKIILGSDGLFWIVSNKDAAALIRKGFETA